MVPAVVAVLELGQGNAALWWAAVIFTVASLSDMLDGKIARKRNLITDFGKFMDPLADKMLICSVLICLAERGMTPAWAVILITAREFAASGLRMLAASQGIVLAAGWLGKRKANVQTLWIISLLVPLQWSWWKWVQLVLMIAALLLTVWSLADYFIKNKGIIRDM